MVTPRTLARTGWTGWRLLGAAAVLGLGGMVTAQAWQDFARIVLTGQGLALAYLPLIPLVIAWIVYVRRQRLRLCRPGGTIWAPVVVVAGWLIHSHGAGGGPWLALHAGAWLVMLGCLMAVCWQAVRQFAPAVGALAFVVPAPMLLAGAPAGPFERVMAELIWTLCHLLGAADGGMSGVSVATITRTLAEASSGVHLLAALCVVAYAFAFGWPLRWPVRFAILAVAPVAAVLCSVAGLVVMVWLLERVNPAAGLTVVLSRWGILLLALLALGGLLRLMAWAAVPMRMYPLASVDRESAG